MSSINRSAMNQHQLAKLPDLVRQTIFKFLECDDLLNLVMLYSDLAGPITSFVKSKTVVINQDREGNEEFDFNSDYLVGKSLVRFRMKGDMHLAIKNLVLYNPSVLFNLTAFDNLTYLKIESNAEFKRPGRMTISLENLERFEARFTWENVSIVLDTPKLLDITSDSSSNQLKIIHPRSIQSVDFQRITPITKQMVNLVTLDLYHFSISEVGSLLSDLKQLKKFYFYEAEDALDATNEHLRSALLANPNLKIFYKRIDFHANPLHDAALIQTSDQHLDDQSIQIYQKYIDAVDDHLNHSTLKIRDFESLSVELIRKLTYLENLHVLAAITDAEKWVELLKCLGSRKLTIRPAIEEHHLDLIPEHCSKLTSLEIVSFERGDWVLRLKFLQEFKTGALFDFGLFKRMVQQLYYLKAVRISESHEVKIEEGWIECYAGGELVSKEPKLVFLQLIEQAKLWSTLFNFHD